MMKPFNLEKALAGEPVKLRNGSKAYVKYKTDNRYKTNYPLHGFIISSEDGIDVQAWTLKGKDCVKQGEAPRDIIGMWQEPRQQATITIPAPLSFASASEYDKVWMLDGTNLLRWKYPSKQNLKEAIDSGALLFASYLDGEAFLQAMREARR